MTAAARHFDITWSDLTFEAQQNIIASVKESLLEQYETEGKEQLQKDWHVKPKTWQEAYCRDACVDHSMWSDLDENSPEFQNYDWKLAIEQYAEDEAEKKASAGARYLELEVEV